jgi:ParB family chromosome partitioning protein
MNKKKINELAKKVTERRTIMNITAQMDVSKLKHHPKNPRKDLGDLEELTKSIKANGIMQNLTIIPINGAGNCTTWENAVEYWVLIGNRRFEAAKRAGLDKVPCTIVENISECEQISIMLEENMQRTDLTPVEQAEGFQLMLDLGETVETIVEKTGFNKATVYHRLNLAKLDRSSLRTKQEEFQLSLSDLYALEQIRDVGTRNKILKEAESSNDIRIKANIAAENERFFDTVREATKWLNLHDIEKYGDEYNQSKWSKTTSKTSTYHRWLILAEISLKDGFTEPTFELPEGTFFEITEWDKTLKLLVEHPHYGERVEVEETPKEAEARKRREEQQEKENRLKHLADEFKKTFKTFVIGFLGGEIKAPMNLRNIYQYDFFWEKLRECGCDFLFHDELAKNYNELYKEIDKPQYQLSDAEIKKLFNKAVQLSTPEQMLLYIYGSLILIRDTVDYKGEYEPEDAVSYKVCKEILEAFELSVDEETSKMIDGTHSYYSPSE